MAEETLPCSVPLPMLILTGSVLAAGLATGLAAGAWASAGKAREKSAIITRLKRSERRDLKLLFFIGFRSIARQMIRPPCYLTHSVTLFALDKHRVAFFVLHIRRRPG